MFLIGALLSYTVFYSILPLWSKPAFGDGLTQEQLTASLGNRKADLLIKMIPPVVTTATLQNGQKPVVEFRLFDSNTNKSFSHITYYIIIEKDSKRLLADLFHDHNGDLRIQINPSNSSQVSISGQEEPLLGGYIGTLVSPVTVTGPIFIKGGLYHFIVRIETVDSDNTLLPDNQEPIYDSWLSIGIAVDHQIDLNHKLIPIKIISYYDKINNVTFQSSNKLFTWAMPFNWNLTRIEQQPIFVHEEVRLPKSWKGFGDSPQFNATVNGQPLAASSIAIDPFSVPNETVVHYLINKSDLIKLGQQMNSDNKIGLMSFTLSPLSLFPHVFVLAKGEKVVASENNTVLNKGLDLYHLGNYTGAIEYYDKALAMNPNDLDALTSKGTALDVLGNHTGAIEYYDKALAIDPKDVYVLTDKGVALDALGNQKPIPFIFQIVNSNYFFLALIIVGGLGLVYLLKTAV